MAGDSRGSCSHAMGFWKSPRGEPSTEHKSSQLPDSRLLNAFGAVLTNRERETTDFETHLSHIIGNNTAFKYPGARNDKLYRPDYLHGESSDCTNCEVTGLVARQPRAHEQLIFHQSTILSGNQLIKDGRVRDRLSRAHHNARCIEMEAAGVIDDTRCLVIRGIADYSDGHKDWFWQNYAAATAAAFAKELLCTLAPVVVQGLPPAKKG